MEAADANDELVEWLDDDGHVVAVVPRSRMRAENLLHKSVGIIVQSSNGRLLVHQRSAMKDLRPSWWDVTVGGVVSAGETALEAARRELAEEVGIAGAELEWLARERFDGPGWSEVCDLYRVVHDGPFVFADGEVQQARLVTPAEFSELTAVAPFLESVTMVMPFIPGFVPHDRGDTLDIVHRVEFTVEPFIEGQPGPYVVAPIDALTALGIDVEVGPFGSSCLVEPSVSAEAVAVIVREAFGRGATRVNIDVAVEGSS